MEGYNFYMITLDRCQERRNKMYELYDKDHLKVVEAYDGDKLDTYTDIVLPNKRRLLKPGEYGCSLSHIKAIKQAFDNGDHGAFIIEDDMHNIYSHLWDKSLKDVIENSPDKTECIVFYTSNPAIIKKFGQKPKQDYMLCKWTWSTGCYFINRGGMKRILKKYVKDGKIDLSHAERRLDIVADGDLLYKQMRSYFYMKPTFIDCCEESIIHPNHIKLHKKNHSYVVEYFKKKQNKHNSESIVRQ